MRTLEGVTQSSDKFRQLLDDISNRRAEVQDDVAAIDGESFKRMEEDFTAFTIKEKDHYQRLLAVLNTLQMPIHRMKRQLQMQQEYFDSKRRTEVLNWLSSIPYTQHHQRIYSDVLSGTGAWFLTEPRLVEWQALSSSSFIWLHGIPGCGKTKLT